VDELASPRDSRLTAILGAALSAYALYWVVAIVEPLFYRVSFMLVALVLTFLLFPARARSTRATTPDIFLVALSVAALAWPLLDLDAFRYRSATPSAIDLACGVTAVLLVLEATRRTVGWILPVTALAFIAYAYLGPLLDLIGLGALAHRGYYPDRLIGTIYMTFDGIFGTPFEVATTYIILFAIFGAVLEKSGAGRFFIDWSMAAMRQRTSAAAPGRAVTLAGLLLGTVSGSGVANTVTLGSVAWPMLKRAGYSPETGGAILSAAGIGAIMAPPAMGAAAFLIAEFLGIRYLDVILMAIVPATLYYVSVLFMIEGDSRRVGTHAVVLAQESLAALTRRYWYHFLPLVAIVVFLALGFTPFRAVAAATLAAVVLSFARRETALVPHRLAGALSAGARATLSIAATTATAGIIVGVVTLTGLGLRISGIVVEISGGNPFFTVLLAAVAVWMLGLAVPVTASYIIAAVMVAPALTAVGIPVAAAHMFIFYYAVLSEVTPPTALSPFAAAAITGGNAYRTMMLTWKYTLPAFLVPLVFTRPDGAGILLHGAFPAAVGVIAATAAGIAGLAIAFGGWIRGAATRAERLAAGAGGVLLLLPGVLAPFAGGALLIAVVAAHIARRGRQPQENAH
jgi:TRAP transporter 4TM/12TM fusion protein